MESRIILSTADFSANNLGVYVALSDLTKKVLGVQTQYDEDSNEANALNTFLANLTNDGFIGGDSPKLSVLMIPALASEQSQLFYNICALDANGTPTNWMPSAGSSKYAAHEVDGHIVGAYANAVVANDSTLDAFNLNGTPFTKNALLPSFTIFNYLSRALGATNPQTRAISSYNYGISIKHSAAECSVGLAGGTEGSTKATAATGMTSAPKGFYGMSYDGSTGSIILNNNGNAASSSVSVNGGITAPSIGYVNTNMGLLSGNATAAAATHSAIIGFGTDLTATELATLKGYCDTLASALHV